jgi:hypothetical protein
MCKCITKYFGKLTIGKSNAASEDYQIIYVLSFRFEE